MIPFGKPLLDSAEVDAVVKILSGPQLVHGPATKAFEEHFADRMGARHAIAVSSCTAGLHLSLHVNRIGAGDKVIVPAISHVATAHAVEYVGARPVFVDVEPDTGNINPDLIPIDTEDGLRAMMIVHFLGLPCRMPQILSTARRRDLLVIEDCAIAVDAEYDGVKVGNFGISGCFSFYPTKHMTTIEGGMVTTDDDQFAEKIRRQRAFGYDRGIGERSVPGVYDVDCLGYNYRMNEVEAAVGLCQLRKLDAFQKQRADNFRALARELEEISEITVLGAGQGVAKSTHFCLNAVLPQSGRISRTEVIRQLGAAGIGTSVHYPKALPLFTYYREKYGYRSGQFPNAEWLGDQTISLPVGPHLEAKDPAEIGRAMKAAIISARQ